MTSIRLNWSYHKLILFIFEGGWLTFVCSLIKLDKFNFFSVEIILHHAWESPSKVFRHHQHCTSNQLNTITSAIYQVIQPTSAFGVGWQKKKGEQKFAHLLREELLFFGSLFFRHHLLFLERDSPFKHERLFSSRDSVLLTTTTKTNQQHGKIDFWYYFLFFFFRQLRVALLLLCCSINQ